MAIVKWLLPHIIATGFWIAALTVASNGTWSFGSWRGAIAYWLVVCGGIAYQSTTTYRNRDAGVKW